MTATVVVIMARRLLCRYPSDPCERHDGSDKRHPREPEFETCDDCRIRRVAEAVKLPEPAR